MILFTSVRYGHGVMVGFIGDTMRGLHPRPPMWEEGPTVMAEGWMMEWWMKDRSWGMMVAASSFPLWEVVGLPNHPASRRPGT